MSSTPSTWTDDRLDQTLGNLLRFGVLLSAAVVFIGACIYLVRHGAEPMPEYAKFQGVKPSLRDLHGIVAEAWGGSGRGIIQLGVLILIATPIGRVVFSVCSFAWQRDWMYVAVTLIVLAALLYSLLA